MIAGILTGLVGIVASRILFFQFPVLAAGKSGHEDVRVSVIIPARNEAKILPDLLEDLKRQAVQPFEVICVDDESSDDTAAVAAAHGARVITVPERPEGWLGKPWACETGAQAAVGECLLFLDADVRLAPDAMCGLLSAYQAGEGVVSIQPFHRIPKGYEQLALFFNAMQFGANGAALPRPRGVGLFGPVILMSRAVFDALGGFVSVRSCIIEDLALGERLREAGIGFRLFAGDGLISFRMYREGFRALVQGWTKNFAEGASKTPLWLFGLVCVWVTGCTSVPFRLILSATRQDWMQLGIQAALYALWGMELSRIATRLGSFRLLTILGYPYPLMVFLWVFLWSWIKKALRLPVYWKGREIRRGR